MIVVIGFVAASLVAYAAWRAKALTLDGALAAVIVGTATIVGLQLAGALVLLAFFVPSVALSRLKRPSAAAATDGVIAKQGPRDAVQVLANGGAATACALLAAYHVHWAAAGFAGAFATAAADTWATEIGTRYGGTPRSLTTWKPIAAGFSGGITREGILASFGGAIVVAMAASLLHLGGLLTLAAAGVLGSLIDSALGASLQVLRFCPSCRSVCETRTHRCGTATEAMRGIPWIDNDAVNLISTFLGAAIAATLS